jgi:hypothetical protein
MFGLGTDITGFAAGFGLSNMPFKEKVFFGLGWGGSDVTTLGRYSEEVTLSIFLSDSDRLISELCRLGIDGSTSTFSALIATFSDFT